MYIRDIYLFKEYIFLRKYFFKRILFSFGMVVGVRLEFNLKCVIEKIGRLSILELFLGVSIKIVRSFGEIDVGWVFVCW